MGAFQQDIMHRGQEPSAMINLKQFNDTRWDPKEVSRNFSENCKMINFIIGILSLNIIKVINLLKKKRNLLYIRNQFVPRSKHFPPRFKDQSVNDV